MNRIVLASGRVGRAAALAAAGVGLVWGAGQIDGGLDLAQASDTQTTDNAAAPISRTELVCPGADRPGVTGVADPDQTVTSVTASAPRTLVPRAADGGSATATTLPGDKRVPGTVVARGGTRPVRVDGPAGIDLSAQGGLAPGLSAVQVGVERADSVKGLTMTPCAPPQPTSYLLAGGARTGQAERIVLTNPAPNPVPVTLSVLGTSDKQSVVVPSRSRKVIVLGSVNDTAKAPVVKVSAVRGTIAATLVESTFSSAVPRGTEAVGSAQQPGRTHLVPSLVAPTGGTTAVRIGVPGSKDAIVRMTLISPDGTKVPDDLVKTVPGGSSTDVSLPDLPSGHYAVRITSDEPVVAAGRSQFVASSDKPGDMLWSPATEPLTGLGGLAVPKVPGGAASLLLAAPGDDAASASVVHVDETGATRTDKVTVPAGETRSVKLGSDAAVWVRPTSPSISAAMVVVGKDGKRPLLSGAAIPETSGTSQDADAQVRPAD